VDGFNLYFGAVKNTPYKWLNIAQLCAVLFPKVQVNHIHYFTAPVNGVRDPNAPLRQQIYLRALQTVPNLTIHHGFFLTKKVWAPHANPPPVKVEILKTEEKGSDVNLATHLLLDAFKGNYQQAVVVSNDSDLCEPMKLVQAEFGLPVGFVNPHCDHRPAVELQKVARFWRPIRKGVLAGCQFPATMTDANGTFSKPPGW
jgi:hypothetical protein